jgi:hypothetical protein
MRKAESGLELDEMIPKGIIPNEMIPKVKINPMTPKMILKVIRRSQNSTNLILNGEEACLLNPVSYLI